MPAGVAAAGLAAVAVACLSSRLRMPQVHFAQGVRYAKCTLGMRSRSGGGVRDGGGHGWGGGGVRDGGGHGWSGGGVRDGGGPGRSGGGVRDGGGPGRSGGGVRDGGGPGWSGG